jgi:HKD family nuclease
VDRVVEHTNVAELSDERPADLANVLRAVHRLRPDGAPRQIDAPLIPLLDSALLTNSPGEPAVGHQVAAEIASADRIDLIMAFIRRSGIRPLREKLRRHVADGGRLRVLTTTYTGSTEAAALDWLSELGADVRVSYDVTGTRLHAKAWLFHRDSGFATAYVGSSNLTHWAQATGLEWNVRISGARNRSIIDKVAAVFESYWEESDFEPYDPARFALAVDRGRPAAERLVLSPTEVRPTRSRSGCWSRSSCPGRAGTTGTCWWRPRGRGRRSWRRWTTSGCGRGCRGRDSSSSPTGRRS